MGAPENVLPICRKLKEQIEHSAENSAETQKVILKVERNKNPMFF